MTTVTNTLIDATSTPIPGVPVEIRLLAPTETNESFIANDSQVVARISAVTNSNGTWTLDLIPNADITPSGSQYEVIHIIPGFETAPESLLFEVIDSPTPISLHDLLV
jgi:hypothetical protein